MFFLLLLKLQLPLATFDGQLLNYFHHFFRLFLKSFLFLRGNRDTALLLHFVPKTPAERDRVWAADAVLTGVIGRVLVEVLLPDLSVLQTHDLCEQTHVWCPCRHQFVEEALLVETELNFEKFAVLPGNCWLTKLVRKASLLLLITLDFFVVLVAHLVLRKDRLWFKLEFIDELSVLWLHFEERARLRLGWRLCQLGWPVSCLGPLVWGLLLRIAMLPF